MSYLLKISSNVAAIVILLGLVGCEPANQETYTDRMGHKTSQENQSKMHAALSFYYAIYREGDINKAKSFTTDRLAKLLTHYGSASAIQRYVLNRYFDSVEIEIDPTSFTQYLNRKNEQRVTLVFQGTYNGEQVKDRRDIVLVRDKEGWLVDQILDPRYRP